MTIIKLDKQLDRRRSTIVDKLNEVIDEVNRLSHLTPEQEEAWEYTEEPIKKSED